MRTVLANDNAFLLFPGQYLNQFRVSALTVFFAVFAHR